MAIGSQTGVAERGRFICRPISTAIARIAKGRVVLFREGITCGRAKIGSAQKAASGRSSKIVMRGSLSPSGATSISGGGLARVMGTTVSSTTSVPYVP